MLPSQGCLRVQSLCLRWGSVPSKGSSREVLNPPSPSKPRPLPPRSQSFRSGRGVGVWTLDWGPSIRKHKSSLSSTKHLLIRAGEEHAVNLESGSRSKRAFFPRGNYKITSSVMESLTNPSGFVYLFTEGSGKQTGTASDRKTRTETSPLPSFSFIIRIFAVLDNFFSDTGELTRITQSVKF